MAQKLLLPFRRSTIICGYKTTRYKNYWGYAHYGIDISTYQSTMQSDHAIRASGDGLVVAAGDDGSLGMGIAIRYLKCESRDGQVKNLIARYMHIGRNDLKVNKGDEVSAGDIIAYEGKEGTSDYHLHFELDTDTTWPVYTPQVSSSNHTFWRKGTDSTVNPSLWLWQNDQAILDQYNFLDHSWIVAGIDDSIPFVPIDNSSLIEELKSQIQFYKKRYENLRSALEELIKKY